VALAALVVLLIFMRRGGLRAAGGLMAEVRRRTRVFRKRTGIFGAVESFPQLTVISDASQGQQFDLEESVVFLGREEDRSDIAFYWDQHVSGRHAKIAQEGAQFYIWDMNSTNGTWVNEERVPRSLSEGLELSEALPLEDGDTVRLGPHLRLRFDRGDGAEQEAAPESDADAARADVPTQVLNRESQSETVGDEDEPGRANDGAPI
jgi:pSer/pThr/pTyr-binding forkhead associated (FHA) protein